jgi:hypothetical protein
LSGRTVRFSAADDEAVKQRMTCRSYDVVHPVGGDAGHTAVEHREVDARVPLERGRFNAREPTEHMDVWTEQQCIEGASLIEVIGAATHPYFAVFNQEIACQELRSRIECRLNGIEGLCPVRPVASRWGSGVDKDDALVTACPIAIRGTGTVESGAGRITAITPDGIAIIADLGTAIQVPNDSVAAAGRLARARRPVRTGVLHSIVAVIARLRASVLVPHHPVTAPCRTTRATRPVRTGIVRIEVAIITNLACAADVVYSSVTAALQLAVCPAAAVAGCLAIGRPIVTQLGTAVCRPKNEAVTTTRPSARAANPVRTGVKIVLIAVVADLTAPMRRSPYEAVATTSGLARSTRAVGTGVVVVSVVVVAAFVPGGNLIAAYGVAQ